MRRVEFDRVVRLGWVRSPQSVEVRFGTSRAGTVDVALCTTASVDAVLAEHPEVDWEQLRTVEKDRRSLLAAGVVSSVMSLRIQRRQVASATGLSDAEA